MTTIFNPEKLHHFQQERNGLPARNRHQKPNHHYTNTHIQVRHNFLGASQNPLLTK